MDTGTRVARVQVSGEDDCHFASSPPRCRRPSERQRWLASAVGWYGMANRLDRRGSRLKQQLRGSCGGSECVAESQPCGGFPGLDR